MEREEMRKKINEELKHIPRGSFSQNMLRMYYNGIRMHDLSQNLACAAKKTVIKAVEAMKKNKPDFSPIYDREFFNL